MVVRLSFCATFYQRSLFEPVRGIVNLRASFLLYEEFITELIVDAIEDSLEELGPGASVLDTLRVQRDAIERVHRQRGIPLALDFPSAPSESEDPESDYGFDDIFQVEWDYITSLDPSDGGPQ